MQESILSLMQMAKTSAALVEVSRRTGGLVYFCYYGSDDRWSFRKLCDAWAIYFGRAWRTVWFCRTIVIEQTIRQKLPDNFQTAEFNLQHGQLDKVVHRKEMKAILTKLLDMHAVKEGIANGG